MSMDCFCERDDDARCPSCREKLYGFVTGFFVLLREFMERISEITANKPKDLCNACTKEDMDYVLAKVVRELVPKAPPPMREHLFQGLIAQVSSYGPGKALPLTMKAWADISAAEMDGGHGIL